MPLAEEYAENGIVHVPGVFSRAEVETATAAVAHLPDWIRRRSGDRNVQRVQPLQSCGAVEDPAWIGAFYDNPALDEAVAGIFDRWITPAPRMSRDPHLTGLLIDPLDRWWSTGLHRDYRDFIDGLDVEAWRMRAGDWRYFNQINIPLLADASLWAVPGSHLRDDLESEARLVAARERHRRCRTTDMSAADVDVCRRELVAALEDCGARLVRAEPGDLVLYRSCMLHCGIYEPGVKRLTLHDAVYSVEWHQYAFGTVS